MRFEVPGESHLKARADGYDEGKALLGKVLANQLAILVKTSQIHDQTNVALRQPTETTASRRRRWRASRARRPKVSTGRAEYRGRR